MLEGKTWEEETLELLQEAREEERRAIQRKVAAERAIESARERIAAAQLLLDTYRSKYGLSRIDGLAADPAVVAGFMGKSTADMLRQWSAMNDETVVVKDACRFLAAAGLFQDEEQASNSLYKAVKRMPTEFEPVRRGVYHRRSPTMINLNSGVNGHFTAASTLPTAGFAVIETPDDLADSDDLPF